ncbi:MAG TPA: YIP1 family protein [Candidatus Limnocylindria bacterium]|jgi:hypothetical protein|nr:YIP1 family protein [Candidatus Limnocylindria bacterium]
MDLRAAPIVALARSPSAGAPVVLARGSLLRASLFVLAATAWASLVAVRVATETNIDEIFLPETRHPAIAAMIGTLGPERTAVVIYLIQRSFDAVLIATAITPLFVWLLASSAVHASARLAGVRRAYLPVLVLFGYAAALTLVPSSAAALALGTGPTLGAKAAQIASVACLLWLVVIAYRGVRAHYGVDRDRAIRILVVAIVLFYLVPLVLIVGAATAIVVAALILGYF